jgi:hypothetical protein
MVHNVLARARENRVMGSKIHRTTISIPADLRKEMDAVKDQVNWSAVAAAAFRSKLIEVKFRRRGSMSKEDVVKRLKAIQEQEEQTYYEDGKQAGREWAEETAFPKELRRLAAFIDQSDTDNWCWWDADHVDVLVFAIWPNRKDDRAAVEEFWEQALGEGGRDQAEDSDFLHGFGDGAVEVWEEVKGQL